ncbi:ketoacyl-ACP synthase III family protein [Amycolatopsis speibonae]|uniref:Ketoacyl-ACP synthase III family protein n=1 Tax=Amycolatopsis speibonae TaxID=1450224 RepID=A0ABV7P3Q8_9PSEU
MKVSGVFVGGLGSCLPETVRVDHAVQQNLIAAEAAERYGIQRVTDAKDVPAPELALHAARTALGRAGRTGHELSLVLYVSVWAQGPHGWCPQYYVQRGIEASAATAAEVRQSCMGMFSALELGASHLMADPGHSAALLTTGDNFNSPLLDRWQFSPHFVMGDAGSAVVLTRDQGFARLCSINAITLPEFEPMHRDSEPLFPPGSTLGKQLNFGDSKKKFLESRPAGDDGPLRIVAAQDEVVTRTLEESGIEMSDVTRVGYVNGSRERVEGRAMIPLGLPMSRSTWEQGRTVGHIGASDQIVALEHLIERGELTPGDHFMMLGVGPGLNIACAVFEILRSPGWAEVAA